MTTLLQTIKTKLRVKILKSVTRMQQLITGSWPKIVKNCLLWIHVSSSVVLVFVMGTGRGTGI